ncbi:MAG: methyltransferase [Candidatus Diapherotrites archaeon]|nr:methyltransferase [Candidatus Diapherotrites archaeon]
MTRVLHFVKKSELRKFVLQNQELEIEVNGRVFPPSLHGEFFAQNFKVNKDENVIDVGTGTGILGILAAKLGGKVYATDISKDAIELAKLNAEKNNVKIEFRFGQYFAGFEEKFDVIIANLPQEIVHKSYKKTIGSKLTKSINGGSTGNMSLLEFFDVAKDHMHGNSRLYIIVNTVTDYSSTLRKIIKNYSAKLIAFNSGPTKEFVEDNIDWYLKLNEQGKIKIFKEKNKWKAHEYLFELSLK